MTAELPECVEVEDDGHWVSVSAGTSYEEIAPVSLTVAEAIHVALAILQSAHKAHMLELDRLSALERCLKRGHDWEDSHGVWMGHGKPDGVAMTCRRCNAYETREATP